MSYLPDDITRSSKLTVLQAVVHQNNFGGVPPWYRPRFVVLLFIGVNCANYVKRPSQLHFPHRVTADYFAWYMHYPTCESAEGLTAIGKSRPGFRERLVFSDCEILTDRFFKSFASCFRLSWPHSISSAYEIQPGSALYSFSSDFGQHVVDLSKWTMCKAFFSSFPALEEDMLSENGTPSSLTVLALDSPDLWTFSAP